jgi:hypothetical protein
MVDEERRQKAIDALAKAFASGQMQDVIAARQALAEEQLAQEAKDFSERRTQDVLAGMETPPEREARIKAGLKARWQQAKARALATIARVEAADWNQKRKTPPQSLLSRLNQRYRNAKTTAERREIRMLMLAQLRMDNPSSQYRTRQNAATPYQRLKTAKTPTEYRAALQDMAVLAETMKKRGRSRDD